MTPFEKYQLARAEGIRESYEKFPMPFRKEEHDLDYYGNKAKQRVPPHFCGRWSVRLVEHNHRNHIHRLNCKTWRCPRCGPKKAKRYKFTISRAAEKYHLQRFMTLTLDPKKLNGEDPVRYLRDCWAKFRQSLRRQFGEAPQYICVLEFQKNGNPHLHILVDRWLKQEWVKTAWQSVGGGQHVDIRFVDIHRVSRYLSKYLTKELILSAPLRSRRVTTSQGIRLNEDADDGEICADIFRVPADQLLQRARSPLLIKYDEDGILQSFAVDYDITRWT